MSKKTKIIGVLIVVIVIVLGAGGFYFYKTSTTDKEIKKGIEFMSEKQYEKAVASFELILDENSGNTEAIKLKDMVQDYIDAKKLFDENKFNDAKEKVDSINQSYNDYPSLKEDVNNLKNKINDEIKSNDGINKDINKIRDLINKNDFDEAKRIIKNLQSEKLDETQKQQVSDLEGRVNSELEKADLKSKSESKPNGNNTNQNTNESSYTKSDALSYLKEVEAETPEFDGYMPSANQIYNNWDNALNFLWGKLKEELPQDEFNKLNQEEIEWIKYKESDAKQAAENSQADEGSEMYRMDYILEAASSTQQRCYQLAAYLK